MTNPLVSILIGSDSDLSVMQEAAKVLKEFNLPYEITVLSAHRTPAKAHEYAKTAIKRGLKIIIAGAGGAAHLAGVMAAITPLPVIGVPVKSKTLNGLDSLLSTVQMPPGVPVATVAVNGAKNAGLLAVQMLALSNKSLMKKLVSYKKTLAKSVLAKAKNLKSEGFANYLKNFK
jgi:5-(carboxyamino)imidazole ribonucleotide mutase